jgi:Family of unknown function (DUF5519)
MNATRRAIEQLESWPDITSAPASCGTGAALWAGSREIVHFHSEHDADLHLTSPAIARLHAELDQSTAVRLHPGSEWATLHLDCSGDADLLITLVSVALKAHVGAGAAGPPSPSAPCNLARVEIMSDGRLAPGEGAEPESAQDPGDESGRSHARRFTRTRGRTHHRAA